VRDIISVRTLSCMVLVDSYFQLSISDKNIRWFKASKVIGRLCTRVWDGLLVVLGAEMRHRGSWTLTRDCEHCFRVQIEEL
jgi:hypothetical protein